MSQPDNKHSGITFILTSCGRFDLLEKTLESFLDHNTAAIERYLVIDDSGDNAVHNVTRNCKVPIEVIVNKPVVGQMTSIDRAYSTVRTPYVFHCEDDWVFFRSCFIEESLILLQSDPTISVVSCRRLTQKPLLAEILKQPVRSLGNVEFLFPAPDWSRLWDGYTFNPGLRWMADCKPLGSFAKWGRESDVSLEFKRKGMRIAYLAEPACETIGAENRLPKMKPPRPIKAHLNRAWSIWNHFIKIPVRKLFSTSKW